MDITRYHTHKKEILRFSDVELDKMNLPEFKEFLVYVDSINRVDIEAMTTGQWKKLYACLRKITDKTQNNYCIYENPHQIQFDITSHCLGMPDEISGEIEDKEVPGAHSVKETALDKLKRYKEEIMQIDLKIAHLQNRRKEYLDKIEPLKTELASLLEDITKISN